MTSHARSIEEISAATDGPPPDFLSFRANQLELLMDLSEVELNDKTVLEIGGGVSGQSLILSKKADLVVCIDLLDPDTVHAGRGEFLPAIEKISANRLRFTFASAECIPLKDSSVDVVFSNFVFEHITDRERAIQEIKRVLKRDGIVITNVPNVMEPIFRSLWYFLIQVPKQLLKLFLFYSKIATLLNKEFVGSPTNATLRSGWAWMRTSLAYSPHGEYPSHVSEIVRSRPTVWDRMFEDQGFSIESRFAIAFESYGAFFRSRPAVGLQRALKPLVLRYGRSAFARALGTSYCFVARRPSE